MIDDIAREAVEEAEKADDIYGPFASTHEAMGVIHEEFLELVDAIRSNDCNGVQTEAIQVAAACLRLVRECQSNESFRERSGF